MFPVKNEKKERDPEMHQTRKRGACRMLPKQRQTGIVFTMISFRLHLPARCFYPRPKLAWICSRDFCLVSG